MASFMAPDADAEIASHILTLVLFASVFDFDIVAVEQVIMCASTLRSVLVHNTLARFNQSAARGARSYLYIISYT